jgi:hypothetical protein
MKKLEMHNFSNPIGYHEAQSLEKCFEAYSDECANEIINEIGFDSKTKYVYIALENGISICSKLGSDVEYLVTNLETFEQTLFESYESANQLNTDLNVY